MNDFAAAAMLRLIGLGLRRQGINLPLPARSPQARVPLADKRALLDRLWREHGAIVLLRIGEALGDAADEPALVALAAARDPVDLVLRWQRLERYVHSRHRVVIDAPTGAAAPATLRLRHVSLDPLHPPSPAEDLLVLGLLAVLTERLGLAGLQVRAGAWCRTGGAWVSDRASRDEASPPSADRSATACWSFEWQGAAPAAAQATPDRADWVATAAARLAADTGRNWTLALLARDLGSTPRSLQRHLAAGGQTFSGLLRDARLALSARLLVARAHPTSTIGYLCGFADQAHFTRTFKRHSAFTPGQFREAFVLPAAERADAVTAAPRRCTAG